MWRIKLKNFTFVSILITLSAYLVECTNIEGKILEPIYWNSSNPLFKTPASDSRRRINAAINDKLDIICPRYRDHNGNEENLVYFKLYLVDEENYRQCNSAKGRRLLTCSMPEQEKKYTFYFQELSPSPWGLEFKPGNTYYVISTSDGTESGVDTPKGGVCTRFNMKLELEIFPPENPPPDLDYYMPEWSDNVPNSSNKTDYVHDTQNDMQTSNDDLNPDSDDTKEAGEKVSGNGLIIGAVLGACAVLFIVLLAFLGYKVFSKRKYHKRKYQSPPISPTQVSSPLQRITLVPIPPQNHHRNHHHCGGRLLSDRERHLSTTLSSHGDSRPPPPYTETFLANGGAMVEV